MLTRFRDFVVKNKLYVGIGGVALALCSNHVIRFLQAAVQTAW